MNPNTDPEDLAQTVEWDWRSPIQVRKDQDYVIDEEEDSLVQSV